MISLPVLQLTPEGKFIKEFESVTEASKELGILRSTISSSCNGRRKLGFGFKWVYRYDLLNSEYLKLIANKD
jgi:hypothetical protein